MSREQERAKRKLEKNPIVECNRIYNNELEIKNDMTKERMVNSAVFRFVHFRKHTKDNIADRME